MVWFETSKPGFLWHTVNAYEEINAAGEMTIVCFMPVFDYYPSHIPIHLPDEPPSLLTRYVLNLSTGKVDEERVLSGSVMERPRMNDAYTGRKARWAYLRNEDSDKESEGGSDTMGTGITKFDLEKGKVHKTLTYGGAGGEPLFVPRKPREDEEGPLKEDDGFILDMVYTHDGASEFVVYNAKTFDKTPIARVVMPNRVPFGVHGFFMPEEDLDN